MDNFCNLHGHSEFSSLDGFCKINDLVKRVCEIEQPAIALTDHGNINGVYKFHKACKKNNIKPIVGCEMYICEKIEKKRGYNHITLLCKNEAGWKNLVQLTKIASHQFYYKPRISLKDLGDHSEGLICLSGCIQGMCSRNILDKNFDKFHKLVEKFYSFFGKDFFFEIMDHGLADQKIVNEKLREYAKECGIRSVATNDYHYIQRKDAELQDILLCDQTKRDIDDPTRLKFDCDEFYVKTRSEMVAQEEELDATIDISDMCELSFRRTRFYLPANSNDYSTLSQLVQRGVKSKKISKRIYDTIYAPRIREELKVIKNAGFMGYFLTVSDYVSFAKRNDILVGPGRGSVGGCLIAYFLGITTIDPIKHNLLFSRFYNEGRKGSLPDIDIDFPEKSTKKVIDYITKKYGKDNVAYISTFMKVHQKGAIKLVSRVIKPNGEKIDFRQANSYADISEDEKSSERLAKKDPVFRDILNKSKSFIELTTHQGIHAAGIVISDTPIIDVCPVIYNKKEDKYVTSWDMRDIEEMGLVKFDFLSLTTLDVIQDTLKAVNLDIKNISMEDDKTFQLLSSTTNVGVFQLSSSGMSELANMMVPKNVEDIAVIITLHRPGPLASGIDKKYIKRRFGEESIEYLHPKLEPILKDTYGLMIYQEQVIRLCMDLARFSETEADSLRKGIGKKIPEMIAKMEEVFLAGCSKNGISREISEELWEQIVEFERYGFNKSHAVGYAYIAYYTAYLKAHYPVEFMTATLNSCYDNNDKLEWYLKNCQDIGIEVLPPSIQHGSFEFSAYEGKIIFGMKGIKGIGEATSKKIIQKEYEDFSDFVFSCKPSSDTLEALIESGAFDDMGYNRNQLLKSVPKAIELLKKNKGKINPKARTLFDFSPKIPIVKSEELSDQILSEKEFNRLNTFITMSPIKGKNLITPKSAYGIFFIEGYLQSVKTPITKRTKSMMATGYLLTQLGTFHIIFFPKIYKENFEDIKQGKIIGVKVERKEDKLITLRIYEYESENLS